jgi:hypothetical protein
MTERETAYRAALALVSRIDRDLTRSTGHYRNRAGALLTTLDEVVRAILTDNLLIADDAPVSNVDWPPDGTF